MSPNLLESPLPCLQNGGPRLATPSGCSLDDRLMHVKAPCARSLQSEVTHVPSSSTVHNHFYPQRDSANLEQSIIQTSSQNNTIQRFMICTLACPNYKDKNVYLMQFISSFLLPSQKTEQTEV